MKNNQRNRATKRYKSKVLHRIFAFSPLDVDRMAVKVKPIQNGDTLLVESDNMHDPRVMPNAIDNEVHYEYGYIGATLFMLQSIEYGKSYFHKDSLLYPALFCFRQYVENMIKVILQKHNKEEIYGIDHNIKTAWKRLLKYIVEKDDAVDTVGNIVKQLYKIDKEASTFRYPATLNQQFNQRSKLKSQIINVQELKTRVLQVYLFFDGLYELACRKDEIK